MSKCKISSKRIFRQALAWMFSKPLWVCECQAAIDALAADNKRVLSRMDEDIAAFKAAEAPRVERSSRPFDEAAK